MSNMFHAKYRVYDMYEHYVAGYAVTLSEANAIAADFYDETDGECELLIEKYNLNREEWDYFCDPDW